MTIPVAQVNPKHKRGYLRTFFSILATVILTILSLYLIWGWLTLEDIRKYCSTNKLDFEETLRELVPGNSIEGFKGDKNGWSLEHYKSGSALPVYRYLVPFDLTTMSKDGFSATTGAVLEPFLGFSENVRHSIFCFAVGYLVGLLVIGVERLRGLYLSCSWILLRPLLGGLSAMLLLIIVISGGELIWNEVSGLRGLSVGLIGAIGSLMYDHFTALVGIQK